MQDGHVFEKAGVGVSVVHGLIPPSAVAQMNARYPQKNTRSSYRTVQTVGRVVDPDPNYFLNYDPDP